MSDDAIKRLRQEYEMLENSPMTDIGCDVCLRDDDDYFHWEGLMQGPQDTPYMGAFLYFTIDFPSDFPNSKPEFKFTNKNMYHLNVNSDGHVCVNILNDWNSKTSIKQVLYAIFTILYEQNPESSYWSDKSELYKNNRDEFNRNVIDWVRKYALEIK